MVDRPSSGELRRRLQTVILGLTLIVAACGGSTSSAISPTGPSSPPVQTAVPTSITPGPASSAPAGPSSAPSVSPGPSDEIGTADPTPPPGGASLRILGCPAQAAPGPACIDTVAVRHTSRIGHVGQKTSFRIGISNTGATASSPITVLLFTFEPPFISRFLRPTSCNGCTIHGTSPAADYGLEWPALSPGRHDLTVTLVATGRPSGGRDQSGAYEWIFAAYAEPFATVDAYGPIYTSAAFANGTGATVIATK
jgi:hypothetical protein